MGQKLQTRRATPPGWCRRRRRAEDKCRRSGTPTGEESLKSGRSARRLILVSQRAYWGQWTCGCSGVVRIMMSKVWVCRPVIKWCSPTSVCWVARLLGLLGRGTGAGPETGTGNRRLLQACQVPRWTQLSSRMVDKRCAGTAQETEKGKRTDGWVPGWMERWACGLDETNLDKIRGEY